MQHLSALILLCPVLIGGFVHAQDYPTKQVTIVVPLPPGGGSDRAARQLADHLSKAWKQPVIVENRPGANALVGAQAVARAQPDGHTLLFGTPSISTFHVLVDKPGVDTLRDFAPISMLTTSPYILGVSSQLPVRNLQEFIAYAKANPGKLNYSVLAGGQMLAFEYFKIAAGLDIVPIQYKGEAPAVLALSTNEVQATFASAVTILPVVKAGKVRALGVTTAARAPSTPDVPTLAESGLPGFDVGVWYGVLAPAKTPAEVQRKISDEIAVFAKRPDIVKSFAQVNYIVQHSTPEQYTQYITNEVQRWNEVAKTASMRPNQ